VVLRTRKRLTPKDVAAVKGLKSISQYQFTYRSSFCVHCHNSQCGYIIGTLKHNFGLKLPWRMGKNGLRLINYGRYWLWVQSQSSRRIIWKPFRSSARGASFHTKRFKRKRRWSNITRCKPAYIHIHTYHSRFIPEGVAEVSLIFFIIIVSTNFDTVNS
jgi:hypothetical protein